MFALRRFVVQMFVWVFEESLNLNIKLSTDIPLSDLDQSKLWNSCLRKLHRIHTLPENNLATENGCLED